MSVGDIAGLIAAIAFVLLVGVLAIPLFKLGRVLDEARRTVSRVTDEAVPLIGEVTTTVEQTNHQLGRVDAITANVEQVTTNVSALTSLFAATLGSPVVKVAAFTYGVRRAMSDRRHDEVEKRVKTELKAQRKGGRRRARGFAGDGGAASAGSGQGGAVSGDGAADEAGTRAGRR